MLSLIMDTSNQYLMVALYEDGKCLKSIQELGSKRQSENAIPYLESLLKEYNKDLLNVDEMIITKGPGSYTGVRVAMTIAKTLSVISDVKIKVISSLAAYINSEKCVSVIDARSKKVFVCAYENDMPVIDEQLLLVEEFNDFMKQFEGYTVAGQSEVVGCPAAEIDLAENIYRLALKEAYIDNVDACVPCYIKDVEAKKICL